MHRACKRLERLESAAGEIGRSREPGAADLDDLAAFEELFADGEDPAEVLERQRGARVLRHYAGVAWLDALGELPLTAIGTDGCSLDWFRGE